MATKKLKGKPAIKTNNRMIPRGGDYISKSNLVKYA